jgi:ribonuclease III
MLLGRKATPLEEALGYRFKKRRLLETAVTHRSFANERGLDDHYERLEFLGDAVLGLVAADWLFQRHPERPEGDLSRLKSTLVSARSLARYARKLDLGAMLRVGVGEERSGGRAKRSLLADSMEAVFGAVYRDGGIDAARGVIHRFLDEESPEKVGSVTGDSKTALQELTQARGWDLPDYRLSGSRGPDHDKRFEVDCAVRGEVVGRGEGSSKKVAEQRAAEAALQTLTAGDAGLS